ncbi:hypothetical protein N7490_011428 [Penicillium lividum]|nr:hypothetical protein N7490_011428 [Penicillium lividum]
MGDNTDTALHYGHMGKPFYFIKTESWSFSKALNPGPSIYYTGVTKTVIPSLSETPSRKLFGPYGRPPNPNSIQHAYPDLGVHWPSISDHPSSKLLSATNDPYDPYDPHVSKLLDLGYASVLGPEVSSHISVAATVTGECRNVISFHAIVEDAVELPLDEYAAIVPTIGDEETTEWSTQGAQVQQICFSRPPKDDEDQSNWMAARLLDSTTVFRPLYQPNPAPMNIRHDDPATIPFSLRNSRLAANPVVEILNAYTGGFPHADVAFNPWLQRQLAIVDTRGNWSIWEIQTPRKQRNGDEIAVPGPKGSLSTSDQIDSDGLEHDGWGSIQWVSDFSTILVANRRSAMLFQMEGDEVRSRSIELRMGRRPEWVLEVKRNTQNTSQFFILTSRRLLIYDVRTAAQDEEGPSLPLEASLVRHHFRDSHDTTLRLSNLLIRDSLYLVLYSRVTELIQVFPCPFVGNLQTDAFVSPDPFLLHLRSALKMDSDKPLRYSTFVFKEVDHSPVPGTTHSFGMSLIKLFWVDSSLAVHETLFKGPRRSLQDQVRSHRIEDNEDRNILRASVRPSKTSRDCIDDGFVVNDWDESAMVLQTTSPNTNLISNYEDLDWTLNLTPIYKLALADIAGCAAQAELERSRPTFDKMIEDLEKETFEGVESWQSSQSMLEISRGRPASNDIDQNAYDLQRLLSAALPETPDQQLQHRFMILPLRFSNLFPGMPVASLEKQSSLDFLETYDRLVDEWLANLPHDIPDLTRRMKERIIRGIALDILLARLIRISNEPREAKTPQPDASTMDMPISAELASSQLSSSQTTLFEDRSSQPLPEDEKAPAAYTSLSAFTIFKKSRPLPRNVVNMLSHWQVGSDPSTYKWRKVSQGQEEEVPKRRVRKKRSRLSQQPQSSQQTSTLDTPSLATPSAPQIRTWGSQPDNRFPLLSSQPSISDIPMTQTERGQFGAREVKKSKIKKKRTGGF